MTPVYVLMCSVCTSVILGRNDDLTEEESRLVFCTCSLFLALSKE